MGKAFYTPEALTDNHTHYCPGCTHGIVHRLVAETIDELGIREKSVGVAPVGCAVLIYNYFDCDFQEAAHGRAPAMATGIKRVRPDLMVFTYQGDGDLASIGMGEIIHAANRGEKFTVIFINNAIYGMTGGQMAPTTLIHQRTATTPRGRDASGEGFPLRVSEMLALLPGVFSAERVSLHSPPEIMKTRKAIRAALLHQIEGKAFSLVEILSPCPTYWGCSPQDAMRWIREKMLKDFPLGKLK
ncbi:MAG: thiamine pyrophosphate-dependent enzyme [Desulfobacterales bacterium]|nr:thiamine pyrophosphate-dependent enzyme [Desulfobacterales bacterium]